MALGELDRFSEKLSVPDPVKYEATRIHTRSLERGLEKGRTRAQIAASSLYAACRERRFPKSLDDVAAASGVGREDIARCYRMQVEELGLKIPVIEPAEYMQKVASRAKMGAEVQARALEILLEAEKAGIVAGRDPIGLAGSALYMAAALEGQRLTQAGAAEAAGVTEVTIRKQLKRLRLVLQ